MRLLSFLAKALAGGMLVLLGFILWSYYNGSAPGWMFYINLVLLLACVLIVRTKKKRSTDDPFDFIRIENGFLHFREQRLALETVNKVVVDELDGNGIIQLPYNAGGTLGATFDIKYRAKLKDYLLRNIPGVEIIS